MSVKEAVALVKRFSPEGVRAEIAELEEAVAVEIRPGECLEWLGLGEGDIFIAGDDAVGISAGCGRMGVEGVGKALQAVGMMAIVGVGVGQIRGAGQGDAAVPGAVNGFPCGGPQVADAIRRAGGEFGNDRPLILRRGGIDDEDFQLAAVKERLIEEVFQAATDEPLALKR